MNQQDKSFLITFSVILSALVAIAIVIFIIAQMVSGQARQFYQQDDRRLTTTEQRLRPLGHAAVASSPEQADARPKGAPKPPAAPTESVDLLAFNVEKGSTTYQQACAACHVSGAAGAPKLADKANWQPRVEQGFGTLVNHAIQGFNAMPAKGGNSALSDGDVVNAVAYMITEAGFQGQLPSPEATAAVESAPEAQPNKPANTVAVTPAMDTGKTQTVVNQSVQSQPSDSIATATESKTPQPPVSNIPENVRDFGDEDTQTLLMGWLLTIADKAQQASDKTAEALQIMADQPDQAQQLINQAQQLSAEASQLAQHLAISPMLSPQNKPAQSSSATKSPNQTEQQPITTEAALDADLPSTEQAQPETPLPGNQPPVPSSEVIEPTPDVSNQNVANQQASSQKQAAATPSQANNSGLEQTEIQQIEQAEQVELEQQLTDNSEQPTMASNDTSAAAQPVASKTDTGVSAKTLAAGKKIYDTACQICHQAGLAGAPKTGDAQAWQPRQKQGVGTLIRHAVMGYKAMPAKGGRADLSDQQVAEAVHYMLSELPN